MVRTDKIVSLNQQNLERRTAKWLLLGNVFHYLLSNFYSWSPYVLATFKCGILIAWLSEAFWLFSYFPINKYVYTTNHSQSIFRCNCVLLLFFLIRRFLLADLISFLNFSAVNVFKPIWNYDFSWLIRIVKVVNASAA